MALRRARAQVITRINVVNPFPYSALNRSCNATVKAEVIDVYVDQSNTAGHVWACIRELKRVIDWST